MDRRYIQPGFIIVATFTLTLTAGCTGYSNLPLEEEINSLTPSEREKNVITLPEPNLKGNTSVEEALQGRRSVRVYAEVPLTLDDLGQILWAAQGVTDTRGYRTAPSAGALYPLEIYIAVGDVVGLDPGVYHYLSDGHRLTQTNGGDQRMYLQEAAVNQTSVGDAPATIAITAVPDRTTAKYGERGLHYIDMEAGHASENIYLQAQAIDLGTVTIGAFHDDNVREILGVPEDTIPLYLMPLGRVVPDDN